MFVIFAMALLCRMLSPYLVVVFSPYWSFLGSLQSSRVMFRRRRIMLAGLGVDGVGGAVGD